MKLISLNPPQIQAVQNTEGPLLIFAGAGSGKTRVLVHRMAYLIHEKGVKPWNIFAVTFTNKAAGEMKERIAGLVSHRVDDLWISTFHSAGVRILRRHIDKLDYGPTFVIYDDGDQQTLLKRCMEELQINPKIFNPRAVSSRIDGAKNELVEPEDYPTGDFFNERVAQIYQLYQQRLIDNNALDFGDLLRLPVNLFETHPEVLELYRRQFQYIMVDEYQDTNHAQYRLIKLLAETHQNLCVVGDDDQSIYRWRGADVRNILNFEKDFPEAKVIKLEQNYRSTQNILKAAGEIVTPIEGRQEKTLWTENPVGDLIIHYTGRTEKDEARYAVDQILKLQKQGVELSESAIFYRTNAQSRVFEDELRRQNVPYVIYGGVRFYDRMEIKDILAYLWVLANPADTLHLRRIINVPARGIGKVTLEKLDQFAAQHGIPLLKAIAEPHAAGVAGKTAVKLQTFNQLLQNLKTLLASEPLSHFVKNLMERTGYIEALRQEQTIEAEARLENLEELINVIEEYEGSTSEPTLAGFLDQVALVNSIDNLEAGQKALPLMTLHLAKGLEFDAVFFVGMEEGLLPHSRSLDTPEELDEERRLTYVGMTRARKKLFLSHAEKRKVFGNAQYNLPSRFLDEVPVELIERVDETQVEQEDFYVQEEKMAAGGGGLRGFNITSSTKDPSNPYKIGTRVRHPNFGLGTIRNCEGNADNRKLIIVFQDYGTKKLVASLANLQILN